MTVSKISFINFLTAALAIEVFMLFLFKFTKSPFTGKAINDWYTNFGWSAIILDVLSVIIGFYITKFIYLYLVKKKLISESYPLLKFLALMLTVQILHDFTFYFTVIRNTKIGNNAIMDELFTYSKAIGTGAVLGDSFMYLLATPLLFYLTKFEDESNTFISIVLAYIIGYIIHQKPLS